MRLRTQEIAFRCSNFEKFPEEHAPGPLWPNLNKIIDNSKPLGKKTFSGEMASAPPNFRRPYAYD